MAGIYRTGTVSVTNGSKTVTGSGTSFLANVKVGDQFFVAAQAFSGVVEFVDSNTQIRLYENWGGTTASGLAYWIAQTSPDWDPLTDFASDVAAVLATMASLSGHMASTSNPHSTTLVQAVAALSLTPATDRLAYFTSASAAALAVLTSFGRSVIASTGALPVAAFANVASGTNCAIGGAASNFVNVTGNTAIVNLTGGSGAMFRVCLFASNPLVTHDGTSLILPGGVNFQAGAGDVLLFYTSDGTNWRAIAGQRANGNNVVALTASDITDASPNGRSLITAANYAAMWTALGGGDLGKKGYTALTAVTASNIVPSFATNGTFGSGGHTINSRSCQFIQLDKLVLFRLSIVFTTAASLGGPSGQFRVATGIGVNAVAGGQWPVSIARLAGFKLAAGNIVGAEITPGTSRLDFLVNTMAAGGPVPAVLSPAHMNVSKQHQLSIAGSYVAA